MGYHQAGFEVVGVDHTPQPRYPFPVLRADALDWPFDYLVSLFDVIHASPPCQHYSDLRYSRPERDYPDLVEAVRTRLQATGKPYVIENVPQAPLDGLILCGSMFDLPLRRHRRFASNVPLTPPGPCCHTGKAITIAGHGGSGHGSGYHTLSEWRAAMGIDWMTREEMAEAIPPAYTRWVGRQLLDFLTRQACA